MGFNASALTDTQKRLLGRLAYWRSAPPDYEQYDDSEVVRAPDGTIADVVKQHRRYEMYRTDSSVSPKKHTDRHINMAKAKSKKEFQKRTMDSLLDKAVFEVFDPEGHRAYERGFVLTDEALECAQQLLNEKTYRWLLDAE